MIVFQGFMEISAICKEMLKSRVFGKYNYFTRVYGSLVRVGEKIGERAVWIVYRGV